MEKIIYLVANYQLEEKYIEPLTIYGLVFINHNDYLNYTGNKKKFLLDELLKIDICKVKNTKVFDIEIGSIKSAEHYLILNKINNLISFVSAIKLAQLNEGWSEIIINLHSDSIIFKILTSLELNIRPLQLIDPLPELDFLSEANYSTRLSDMSSMPSRIKILNNQYIFKCMSSLVSHFINWFGLKKIIFLSFGKKKSTYLILFSRYTSRACQFLPKGRVVLCSRYWPKSLKLLTEAFLRINCIVDVFIRQSSESDIDAWEQFKQSYYLDKNNQHAEISDLHMYLKNLISKIFFMHPDRYLIKKFNTYNITDVVSSFDSHYPVIKLLETCRAKGINRHVIQHGIMDYPVRDFLFFDQAYVFSKTLQSHLISKGYCKNQISHISDDLEISPVNLTPNTQSKIIIGKHLYVITSVLPIFSWLPMRTSLIESIYSRFIETILSMGNLKIPVTIVCHPAENVNVYKSINKNYGLSNWNVTLTLDSIKPIPDNSIFIDLGYSTVSVELASAGAVVLKYLPGINVADHSIRSKFGNCLEFSDLEELCSILLLNRFSYEPCEKKALVNNLVNINKKNAYNQEIELWLGKFVSKNSIIKLKYQ
jgi:hypothetical protein